MTSLVEGPAWAPHRLDVRAGRFPLGVEAHLLQMTAHLVPGVTTVTINARYYALHGYVSLVAEERGLSPDESSDLLRRCEVVMAGATIATEPNHAASANPHGYDKIWPAMEGGSLDLARLSQPGEYSKNLYGFLAPYGGSELEMGILGPGVLSPGPRLDERRLRQGFDGLLDFATRDVIDNGDLATVPELSMTAATDSRDGLWLGRLLCSVGVEDLRATDLTRQATIRLLVRALDLTDSDRPEDAVRRALAYGSALNADPVISQLDEARPWRGTLLRQHSVNAWRALWAWLVNDHVGRGVGATDGMTDPGDLSDAAIAAVPTGTVAEFVDALPATIDAAGNPLPAEEEIRSVELNPFHQSLALLALGALRSDQLTDQTAAAFLGRRRTILDPIWMRHQLDSSRSRSLADFVNDFVRDVIDRSQRVAMRKARVQEDGTFVYPTRVHEHAGRLWKTSNEGSGAVGLRLTELTRILSGVGLLEPTETGIKPTGRCRNLLADA